MPIKEAEKSFKSSEIEKNIQTFWNNKHIYEETNKLRKNGPNYSFLDGPPYCSGNIHLGTAWNKIIKDTHLRYKSMNGFNIRRQAGWDMHGLPIEHKVEQLLNIKSKQDIEGSFGIDNFVNQCKEFAIEHKDSMTVQFEHLGVWMDWKKPYMTLDSHYMESSWWTIKKAHERNLLVNDLRVISWCPHCETALAAAEIDYEEKEDPSIYVKFPLKEKFLNDNDLKEFLLVWTTTPWTLPANLAISVNPDLDYVFVKKDSQILILVENLLEDVLGPKEKIHKTKIPKDDDEFEILEEVEVLYEIVKTVKGQELVNLDYVYPLEDEIPKQQEFNKIDNVHKILPGDHVEVGEGTGLVHTAPGHGPDDFEMGKKYDLPIFSPVDEAGIFTSDAGKYANGFVKSTNQQIIDDIENKDLMYKSETISHRYGVCWRCKTPIIYLATKQWFLKITEIKEKMLQEIEKVKWVPEWAGKGRFHDWVANAKDWTISRQRYWGIPIPIWECENCGEIKVIGSLDELKELSTTEINAPDGDLIHRPLVDTIHINCSSCNHEMSRIEDVLDVWMDSGVAPWASLYYPAEKDSFNEWYPYDFITEGHDQTRGWFYSQLGSGVISLDRAPYKKVLMHGFVLDEDGKKMSKSLGNVVSPEEVIEKYGVDILRFYLLWASKPWDDLKFVWDELNNVNKMFNILWNVYVFSTTYMSLDNFNPNNYNEDELEFRDEDKWIISKANSLIKEVGTNLDNLHFHNATRKINQFILDDLSRWYVRLIRGRTWVEADNPDKIAAYYSLYTALVSLITAMSPISPYITEHIYENLVKNTNDDSIESIHMKDWSFNESLIDTELEEKMDSSRSIIEATLKARDSAKHKLRWPVTDITIVSEDPKVLKAVNDLNNIIKDQANAKEVITATEFKNLSFNAKPNLKTLGPRLKGDMGIVKKYLESADGNIIKKELEENGIFIIEGIELSTEDILFESELPDDMASAEFTGGNVFVNTKITPEILSEAMSRELIRRIQDMRKDMDLDVEKNINIIIKTSKEFSDLVNAQEEIIINEVRANSLTITNQDICINNFQQNDYYTKDWKIEDYDLEIYIQRNV